MSKFKSSLDAEYNKLRNKIKKYSAESIIQRISFELNKKESQTGGMPRHCLLLILRMTIEYGEYREKRKSDIKENQFIEVVNIWHSMTEYAKMPSDHESFGLFLRIMAYQQFWLQRDINRPDFARLHMLFKQPNSNHTFNQIFLDKYGLRIDHFLDLIIYLSVFAVVDQKRIIDLRWFSTIEKNYPTGTIETFLSLISADFFEHRANFRKGERLTRQDLMNERSLLRKKPFLTLANPTRYLLLSRSLLNHFINNGLYEMLSLPPHKEKFMNKFGLVFQKYVKKGIDYAGVCYDYEDEVKREENGKSVDFVIHEEKAKIFIDAKGVEMASKGMLTSNSKVISDRLKSSVTSGIMQGFMTNLSYKKDRNNDYEAFLIIVTYKNLYLGSGSDYGDLIGKRVLEKAKENCPAEGRISPGNMFFIDISELEILCELLSRGTYELKEILKYAREQSREHSTKKFKFIQYLESLDPNLISPKFMLDVFDEEYEKIVKSL